MADFIPWPTWTVHRDGATWSGPASCLDDAIERSRDHKLSAERVAAEMRAGQPRVAVQVPARVGDNRTPEQKHADEHATWQLHTGDPLTQVALPGVAVERETVRLTAGEVVCVIGRREVAVAPVVVLSLADAIAWYEQAHARALEMTRARRSAEAHVDFYASGRQRGTIKPPRKAADRPAWCERVIVYREARAAEEAADEMRTMALGHLRERIEALGTIDIDTREQPLAAAAVLRERVRLLDGPTPADVAREVKRARERLQPHVDRVDSAQVFGFVPGELATLLPAPWDDCREPRRVRVLAVEVDPPICGTHESDHRRVVQVLDRAQW